LDSYNTETNDIWSLGVILVNLTCGRNPWRQACPQDETFRAYVHDPDFLRTILPISHSTNQILKGLFALDPKDRMSLRVLRKLVMAVDTFTMTEEELRHAHSAARAAAASVRPKVVETPAAPQVKVNVIDHDGSYTAIDVDHHIQDQIQGQQWSQYSQYADLDQNVLAQIDYEQQHQRQAPVQPFAVNVSSGTPALVGGAADPYALRPTHSRSSSSGDASSLPPTPEFNPADKANAAPAVPEWNLANRKVVEQERPAYTPRSGIRNPFSLI